MPAAAKAATAMPSTAIMITAAVPAAAGTAATPATAIMGGSRRRQCQTGGK
jgi:hypothetical protein